MSNEEKNSMHDELLVIEKRLSEIRDKIHSGKGSDKLINVAVKESLARRVFDGAKVRVALTGDAKSVIIFTNHGTVKVEEGTLSFLSGSRFICRALKVDDEAEAKVVLIHFINRYFKVL